MIAATRKRPWYVRLARHLGSAVNVRSYAAEVPDGFIRQVDATFQIPEPGKGGTNPPTRDVIIRMNPDDARALAKQLNDSADAVDEQNQKHGNGAQYEGDYANVWSKNTRPTRYVPKLHARVTYHSDPGTSEEAQVVERTDEAVFVRPANSESVFRIPRTSGALSTRLTVGKDDWEDLT